MYTAPVSAARPGGGCSVLLGDLRRLSPPVHRVLGYRFGTSRMPEQAAQHDTASCAGSDRDLHTVFSSDPDSLLSERARGWRGERGDLRPTDPLY
jgi:hypothetical protein